MATILILSPDDAVDMGIQQIRQIIRESGQARQTIRNCLMQTEMSPSAALAAEAEMLQLDRIISLGLSTLSVLPDDTSERMRVLCAILDGIETLAGD